MVIISLEGIFNMWGKIQKNIHKPANNNLFIRLFYTFSIVQIFNQNIFFINFLLPHSHTKPYIQIYSHSFSILLLLISLQGVMLGDQYQTMWRILFFSLLSSPSQDPMHLFIYNPAPRWRRAISSPTSSIFTQAQGEHSSVFFRDENSVHHATLGRA